MGLQLFVMLLPLALVKEHAMLMEGLVTAMLDGLEMIATLQLLEHLHQSKEPSKLEEPEEEKVGPFSTKTTYKTFSKKHFVTISCDLQVLDYNPATGLAKYILSFEILDATELEKSLYIINKDIATNTAITASGLSASPGTIVGASELVQGHLEVVGLNRRPRNNHI